MNLRIHNFKLKTLNNSFESVFEVQLQWYTISPIHLKHDTKQNKDKNNNNNNEHKQNRIEGENYLFMGASIWLLQGQRIICLPGPPTSSQRSSLTFAIAVKDLTNNHYK